MFVDQQYEEIALRDDIQWIDVRSESEYLEATIPGAVNVPLFTDEERAQIGTVYKQVSKAEAMELGLVLASAKLPTLIAKVRDSMQGKTPAIFCWRGGMRSKTVATVLDLMGISCLRLTGGYRAYREMVVAKLNAWPMQALPPLIVLHGMTGVGKTTVLRKLAERGEPVLDLEGLAGHRGSVFGGIGLQVANQRQFDSRLLDQLEGLQGRPYLFLEAESRRIGRVTMPEFLFLAKQQGYNIELTAPVPVRVSRTLAQYRLEDDELFATQVQRALQFIEKRFSPNLRVRVKEWMDLRDYKALIEALLLEYYDPRYKHAMESYTHAFCTIDVSDYDQAIEEICAYARKVASVSSVSS
ncbi:tRNA 2-selenouridine(34) synthase MnmH [Sulfoacidibacillus thermotolerans]|uniref:tRNA 2-selenouridine(34) synthase MnmH n=1 Tax=Sulfoacidibacillus thermotolerans TaxID=1765684 RepID=A0A2U3DBK3_SULT2|nr:tRNA 2-selenouridine(34) synthase MnmH [Sulfoacidibacillus thermotolerans]PWI58657.1 tRNA 2-selenouridine(34) synthase MnmH [Sulfoacidibacillus thermotolerans]